MTTQEQRQQWRALAQAATPGEWCVEQHSGILHDGTPSTCAVLTSDEYDMASFGDDEQAMFDAAFIAAARTAVPALLADVDALTQERDAYARMLDAEMLRRQDAESDILRLTEDDTQSAFERTAALRAERDAAYRAIERMSRKQTEMHDTLQARNAALTAERDALAAAWAQVVAISDEMNPKQGGPFGGDTNIAAYNMSRVRDVVREWKEAQNAVFE